MKNQVEQRTGLKDATIAEYLNSDPTLLAIVAPAPDPAARVQISVGEMLYVFSRKDFVGPNDSHERGVGWDRTFEWAQQSDAARLDLEQQVLSLLHGAHCKPIECEHAKGRSYAIVVNGRHSVLAARIANLILKRLKKEPRNVGFRRRVYDEAAAAVAADVANRSYARDPIAVLEQRLYEIEVNGWSDEQAARHFRVKPSTIRGWRHRASAPTAKPSEKGARMMSKKPLVRLAKSFEADHDERGLEMGQLLRYILNPTTTPPAWLEVYLKGVDR
jgi:hypothetical protein